MRTINCDHGDWTHEEPTQVQAARIREARLEHARALQEQRAADKQHIEERVSAGAGARSDAA